MVSSFPTHPSLLKTIVFVLGCLFLYGPLTGCRSSADVKQDEQLEELSKTLKRMQVGRADNEVGLDDFRAEIATLRGQIEEIQHRQRRSDEQMSKLLLAIEERMKVFEEKMLQRMASYEKDDEPKKAEPKQQGKVTEDHLSLGLAAAEAKDCGKAVKHLQTYADSSPKGTQAVKGYIALGDCYLDLKRFPEAVDAYQTMRDRFPKSTRVPQVIYGQAEAFRRMGDAKTAKLFYQEVMDKYPGSPESKLAQKKIKAL